MEGGAMTNPNYHTCDCGRPAVRKTSNGYECQRCMNLQRRRDAEESSLHQPKTSHWSAYRRSPLAKYAEGWTV